MRKCHVWSLKFDNLSVLVPGNLKNGKMQIWFLVYLVLGIISPCKYFGNLQKQPLNFLKITLSSLCFNYLSNGPVILKINKQTKPNTKSDSATQTQSTHLYPKLNTSPKTETNITSVNTKSTPTPKLRPLFTPQSTSLVSRNWVPPPPMSSPTHQPH